MQHKAGFYEKYVKRLLDLVLVWVEVPRLLV